MEKTKNINKIKFLHLVDHDGTIFKLVSPLSSFHNHYVLDSFSSSLQSKMEIINKLAQDKNIHCILHATGNKRYFYSIKENLAKKFKKFYIFLHVSPSHFLIKDRINELKAIKELTKKFNSKILIPSKELKKEYLYYGLKTIPIQLGIDFKEDKKREVNRKKFSKKRHIISVCTAGEGFYSYIKGTDRFYKLIKDLKLEDRSIILGNNNQLFKGIKTMKVSQRDFFNILNKSEAYIQLSRTEAYNLSAVYAKRLKIPIIVSNIEGHKDNVRYGFRVNNLSEAKKILREILSNSSSKKIKRIIEKNYEDSLKRETLNNFKLSLEKLELDKIL